MRKDKEKVLDEVWNEDRIRSFLELEPKPGTNGDFHRLHKAYQSMRAEDFALFTDIFVGAGSDINATDASGRTVLSYIAEHRASADYATVLQQRGAH
jgi:hypothetical protein